MIFHYVDESSWWYIKCTGEKPGNEAEEVKLQNASKQIVQNAILQAVQQVSQEGRQKEDRASSSFRLGVGELTKKHEKK
ncbi:A-kinase anchor protein inhibitor 1 isoform X2 [Tamandua tetradactyla]|uniref:A-kinase anchor protein inhibitor 1 isoform X2 n=1 Tax=Tamandua tetradactyla TaxID=48850 RepID=UPI0040549720